MAHPLGCIIRPETKALHASLPVSAPAMLPAWSRIVGTPRIGRSNLTVGDCAEIAAVNGVQTLLARQGKLTPIDEQVALDVYSTVTGYNPADPSTDRGTDPEQLFAWWRDNAIAGHKLATFTRLNPADTTGIKRAVMDRGGVYLCVELSNENMAANESDTDGCYEFSPIGTPGTAGGHAIWSDEYIANRLGSTSWVKPTIVYDSFLTGGFCAAVYDLQLIAA
jgi:hypothetical protein